MPKDAPNFALLIGKPKGKMDEGPSKEEHAEDLGMDKASAEDSAVKDFIVAVKRGDALAAKEALKDFIQLCYPELEHSEPDGDEEY